MLTYMPSPLQNNLVELWALLHWLYPEVFTEKTAELFKSSFNLTKGQVSTKVMDDSRRLLEIIMLRRMKNSPGVDLNLPPKTEVLLYVPLTPMQRFWYMRLLTRADKGLLEELFQGAQQKEAVALKKEAQEVRTYRSKAFLYFRKLDHTPQEDVFSLVKRQISAAKRSFLLSKCVSFLGLLPTEQY